MLVGKRILLIIGGGIAAYKSLDLIRRLRDRGASVTPVLTRAAEEFVTPLSASALAAAKVYRDLFDLTDEAEMGHIELSRAADLVVVAPATADLMGKMAAGLADDLASTLLMATDKRVLIAPAMNVRMWEHPATRRNLVTLRADGILVVGPDEGPMACGEFGFGRMAEVPDIVAAVEAALAGGPLAGRRIVLTSGPTHEPIDPVRYIANRSSGTQGAALGRALAALGAEVVFVTGPAEAPPPEGARVVPVADGARDAQGGRGGAAGRRRGLCRRGRRLARGRGVAGQDQEAEGQRRACLRPGREPRHPGDVAQRAEGRPRLVVGFAAETDDVVANARAKRLRKGCDWIVANDVSVATGIMGGRENAVTLITGEGEETWPRMSKDDVARRLAERIAEALA